MDADIGDRRPAFDLAEGVYMRGDRCSPLTWRAGGDRAVSARIARELTRGEVHVWSAHLDDLRDQLNQSWRVLDRQERARAERFRSERLRRSFVLAHGFRRELLARYLDIDARTISFDVNAHGKPRVSGSQLEFSLSYSGDLALMAVSAHAAVGVDVEEIRSPAALDTLAVRFFAREESGGMLAMPPDDRLDAFFACWTRKEAFVKARGPGLAIPLDSFDASLVQGAFSKVIDTPEAGACWLSDLPHIKGHAAAVALAGPPLELFCWRWTPQPFTNGPHVSPTVRLTLEFLHEHYTQRIAWRDVAASVRRNGAYLARRFRRETGVTLRQYLSDLRVQRAAQLIVGGDKVEVVMLSVGYHSKRTFYAHFHTAFGVTPGVYRLMRTVDALRLPETARRIPVTS